MRHGEPNSLLLIDIDFFKKINDVYGHDAGDVVLKEVARVLREHTRKTDALCRIGGEEFAVLVPEGTLESCRTEAERIRAVLERTEFEILGKRLRVTASFGVAALDHASDLSGEKLRRQADERLYAAKAAGRNRVVGE